nr:uncharacterized protein CTRU02_15591 [Colletotrichum truncatum]KAF6780885.1 hypothetical protein CTRU02_15591 [Colletotrichum truncatum]
MVPHTNSNCRLKKYIICRVFHHESPLLNQALDQNLRQQHSSTPTP